MDESADNIYVRVPMRDHHAFGSGGCAAGVIDRQKITFRDGGGRFRCLVDTGVRQQRFVIKPARLLTFQRDERCHLSQLSPNAFNRLQIVCVHAHDLCTAVIDEVREVVGD